MKILLIDEVAILLRVTVSTIRRWSSERRKGRGNFPLPISPLGYKCRWRESDIMRFIESQSAPPITPTVTSPAKQRQQETDKKRRLEAARVSLERHRKK